MLVTKSSSDLAFFRLVTVTSVVVLVTSDLAFFRPMNQLRHGLEMMTSKPLGGSGTTIMKLKEDEPRSPDASNAYLGRLQHHTGNVPMSMFS